MSQDSNTMKKCILRNTIFLTFDVEPDAPPYQSQRYLGIEQGLPWILETLREINVKATFFITASIARNSTRYKKLLYAIVDDGHEIGSHGLDHSRLDKLPVRESIRHIHESIRILSEYDDIYSFRAPNLRMPKVLLRTLIDEGVGVDSSIASYKGRRLTSPYWYRELLRVPVTTTSSTIRLPGPLVLRVTLPKRRRFHSLFYHPWEFVKIRRKPIYRPDIWFRTGEYARRMFVRVIMYAKANGYRFALMREAPILCSV